MDPVAPSQVQMQNPDYSGLMQALGPLLPLLQGMQGQQDQNIDQLHQQVAQAQQGAQQAGQQYTDAAQAPQQQGPSNFYDQLLGNTASVLGGNKDYEQQAYQRGVQQQEDLRKSRVENLSALKSNYEQAASNAERLGNTELTAQYRAKVDGLAKTLMTLVTPGMQGVNATTQNANKQGGAMELQGLKGTQATDLEAKRQEGRMVLAKMRESFKASLGVTTPEESARIDGATHITGNGTVILDIGMFVGKSRDKALQWASENGAVPVAHDQMKVLQDIQGAKVNTTKIMDSIGPFLSKTPAERWTTGQKNKLGKFFQLHPELGAYDTFRSSAIRALRAAAGSGGLRMNEKEINLAVQNDIPKIDDTFDTAVQKMQTLNELLDSAEDPITTRDWRTIGGPGGAPAAAPAGESKLSDEEAYKRYQAIAGKKN